MKQLHTFDEVFDSQKVFRSLLDTMANPGRRCSVGDAVQKLFGDEPGLLAAAMTLLDGSVSFSTFGNGPLDEQIVLLTHGKKETPGEADFLFVTNPNLLSEAVCSAKKGTLEDPHASATILVKVPEGEGEQTVWISGPGVDGRMGEAVPKTVFEAVRLREEQEYEYPQGIDFIFLLPGGTLLCIPRLVKLEES